MATYYRDNQIFIDSSTLRIGDRVYRLDDFAYVWHQRGHADLRAVSRRTARWVLTILGLALAILWAVKTQIFLRIGANVPDVAIRIAFVLAASGAAIAIGWPFAELVLAGLDHVHHRGVIVQEIWADWRGEEVLLLRSSDQTQFGQVYRALQRAIEHRTG